jgi:hypothetical protein
MSDDLATESLGHNKLSLWERRQQYEDWLLSGRRASRPPNGPVRTTRIDDGPSTQFLRAKAEADAASRLINPLPPGAVCRTDEGDDNVELSDDLRLKLAGALAKKIDGATPEQAATIAKAGNDLLAPMKARADDAKKDENLKSTNINQGPVKRGSSPGAATAKNDDDDGHEEKERRLTDDNEKPEPTLREVMDALGNLGKRMDALEKKDDDDDSGSEDNPVNAAPLGKREGAPQQLAADATQTRADNFKWQKRMDTIGKVTCQPETQDLFSKFQARSDRVYGYHGQQAPKPLHGETLNAYRRRLLLPFLPYSPAFRRADLNVLAVDPASFNHAEDVILADATAEARNPTTVPMGHLRMRVEQRGGHTYTEFFGRPKSWMASLAPTGKRIKRIDQQNENGVPIKTSTRHLTNAHRFRHDLVSAGAPVAILMSVRKGHSTLPWRPARFSFGLDEAAPRRASRATMLPRSWAQLIAMF